MLQINQKIEQARVSANLTQDQMAEKLGINRSTYQYWEKKAPSIDKVKRIATALNISEDYFFGDNDENMGTKNSNSSHTVTTISQEMLLTMVETNRDLVQSNKKLVDSHYDLVQMLKSATGGGLAGRQKETDIRLAVLHDFVVEFVAEKRKVAVEEINELLSNKERDLEKLFQGEGNPNG